MSSLSDPNTLAEAAEVEEVDVDDDVSAADLSGEAILPTGEVLAESGEPEPTAPRTPWPTAPLSGDEPLWEPTAPQLETEEVGLGILAQARRAALSESDPTGETLLPEEPLASLTPLLPVDGSAPEMDGAVATDGEALSGSLAAVPLIDVLGLLGRQRQTGVLVVTGSKEQRIEITLQKGRVALATGRGYKALRLGRFVVEMEAAAALDIDELAMAAVSLTENALPIGARLCQLGYLNRDDLRHALSRQSQELIYEALRLRSGRFVFTQPEALPRLAVDRLLGADLHLDLEALLLEGYRRIHDWHILEQELEQGAVYLRADDRSVPQGASAGSVANAERLGLTRDEQQVLSLCTGKNAISDIARDSRIGSLDVVRILHRLQAVNLVRRRLPPHVA